MLQAVNECPGAARLVFKNFFAKTAKFLILLFERRCFRTAIIEPGQLDSRENAILSLSLFLSPYKFVIR